MALSDPMTMPTCSGLTSPALVLVRFTSESGHVRRTSYVRFHSKSGLMLCSNVCLLWAKSGH
jgi:hypothetical protein